MAKDGKHVIHAGGIFANPQLHREGAAAAATQPGTVGFFDNATKNSRPPLMAMKMQFCMSRITTTCVAKQWTKPLLLVIGLSRCTQHQAFSSTFLRQPAHTPKASLSLSLMDELRRKQPANLLVLM